MSWKRVQGVLCTAFEGGSNYWYCITEFVKPPKLTISFFENEVTRHLDYPVNQGGALLIRDHNDAESKTYRLDRAAICKGLRIMAEKYPRHYCDIRTDNDDATTGDVMLQCCLFGEIVFG
jgi:hypothetical protein